MPQGSSRSNTKERSYPNDAVLVCMAPRTISQREGKQPFLNRVCADLTYNRKSWYTTDPTFLGLCGCLLPTALTCFYRWRNTLPLWQMHCGTLSQTNQLSQSCFVCFPCQATLENGSRPHGMWDSWPYSRFPSTRAWVGKEDPRPHEREFRWQGWVPQLIPTAVPLKAFLCEPEG